MIVKPLLGLSPRSIFLRVVRFLENRWVYLRFASFAPSTTIANGREK